MPHHLIVNAPNAEPIHYVLRANRIGIGRGKENQIHIQCERISTCHAEITITDQDECRIEDLDSANGTSINGAILKGIFRLEDGDRIRIGDAVGMHYFQPDEKREDSPEFVMEIESPLKHDLLFWNEKVGSLQAQLQILNSQYEEKLKNFQTLIVSLEKLKASMDICSKQVVTKASIEELRKELNDAKDELSEHGFTIGQSDLDISVH